MRWAGSSARTDFTGNAFTRQYGGLIAACELDHCSVRRWQLSFVRMRSHIQALFLGQKTFLN